MQEQSLSVWIQLLATIAVLAGLALVVWELRQAHELARLQYASESQSDQANQRLALQGESVYETLVRACYTPDELTREDAVMLDAYFNSQMGILGRMLMGRDIAALDNNWREIGRRQLRLIVRFPQGEKWVRSDYWWRSNREVLDLLEQTLREGSTLDCTSDFDRILGVQSDDPGGN